MRSFAIGLGLLASLAGSAQAADWPAETACLSSGDTFEAVTSSEVIRPREAIRAARRHVPNAEVMRAALCRQAGALVYMVVLLQKDGRLARLMVDAHSAAIVHAD